MELSTLIADVRYGLRGLVARPTFTVVVVLTLAFGIGVNVAIFSLFEQILLRPLPVPEPERLVNVMDPGPDFGGLVSTSTMGGVDSVFSYPMFRDLERDQTALAGIAAHRNFIASLSTGEQARREDGMLVSGSYFPVLGLAPALGRLLGPQDDRVDGQAESVVLSYAYWQTEFGGDPDVLGRRLIVNGTPLTIIGVAPAGFGGSSVGVRASVFVPITLRWLDTPFAIPNHDNRIYRWVYLFARLSPGVTADDAAGTLNTLYRTILNDVDAPLKTNATADQLEQFRSKALVLEPGARGQSSQFARSRGLLEMLVAISGAVLLLCCANVAGLMLVRGTTRSGEMAVRASIGATRGRLARLLLVESLLLALPAVVASLPIALAALRAIASGTPGLPAAAVDVSLDGGAALVAITIALVSALAFGLLPLRGLVRTDPARALQAYGARQTSSRGVARFRSGLATVQIALSMALLALAGVFAQSLANIGRIDLGLDIDDVVTFSLSPQTSGYTPDESALLFDRLEEALAAIPGVESAATSMVPLLGNSNFGTTVSVDGPDGPISENTALNYVSPGFFRTLGIARLTGRDFDTSDAGETASVAIVNEQFADRFGLGRDAIGRRLTMGPAGEMAVVGLAADAKYSQVTADIGPQMFLSRRQSPTMGSASFYIKSSRPPEDLMAAVRAAVTRVDPVVPIADLRTMADQVDENLARERFAAGTSAAFAVLATVLAGLGLYGVLAYSVAQRSREIGLRFALGAPSGRIRGMVLKQVAVMTGAGIALGAAAAWVAARGAESLLFGVAGSDPYVLTAAAIVLALVTLAAAYVPARRASRVDPMVVLRYE